MTEIKEDNFITANNISYPILEKVSTIDMVEENGQEYTLLTADADLVTLKRDNKWWMGVAPESGDHIKFKSVVLWEMPFPYEVEINEKLVQFNNPHIMVAKKHNDEFWYPAHKKEWDDAYNALPEVFKDSVEKTKNCSGYTKHRFITKEFPIFQDAINLAAQFATSKEMFEFQKFNATVDAMRENFSSQEKDDVFSIVNWSTRYKKSLEK